MCAGISLAWSELPEALIERHGLVGRRHQRGGESEAWFLHRDKLLQLPIWRDGQIQIVRWGNSRGQSRFLPRSGWTWKATLDDGTWRDAGAILVDIPATLGLERGIWFRVRQGMRGILVPDERGAAVCYMLCEPATHYYQVMTRSDRMPVLIEEQI